MSRGRWRRMGLATLLFGRKQGFFIPYRYADAVQPRSAAAWLQELFRDAEPGFAKLLEEIATYRKVLSAFAGPAPQPRWNQDWFPRLDGAVAYTLVRSKKPKRLVEIGSGHSTRFMARALLDEGHGGHLTAIDPAPRAAIAGLEVDFHRALVQDVSPDLFAGLEAGDVLFVDSSHLAQPGSDVDIIFNEIVPALAPGVLLHVHDVTLPDPYPEAWAWRGYNEQLLIPGLLAGGWRLVFASHYVATRMTDQVTAALGEGLDLPAGALETSLWLEKP